MEKTADNTPPGEIPVDKPFVDLVKVSKIFKPSITALQDISISIARGELVFLTGMSGAGKTTLLKLICCLDRPTKGVIEVEGKDLSRLKPKQLQLLRQNIGVAYQNFRILPDLTVFQNISMAMEVAYRSPTVIRRRIDDLLNMLLLTDKRDTETGKLSRGEQQRVAIARAAANSPSLLLADEPTGNLDAETTWQVMNLFKQLNDAGTTLIIATHDTTIYQNTPFRTLNLVQGKLV